MHTFYRITLFTLLSIYLGSARCLPVAVPQASAEAEQATEGIKRDSIGVVLDDFVSAVSGGGESKRDVDFASQVTNNPVMTTAFVPSGDGGASSGDIFQERDDSIDLSDVIKTDFSRKPVVTNSFVSSSGGGDILRRDSSDPVKGEEGNGDEAVKGEEQLRRAVISLDDLSNKPVVLTTFTSDDGGSEAKRRRATISLDELSNKPVVLTTFTSDGGDAKRRDISLNELVNKPVVLNTFASDSSSDDIARREQQKPGANAVAFVSSSSSSSDSGGDLTRRGHDGNLYAFSSEAASDENNDTLHKRVYKISFAPAMVNGNFAGTGGSDAATISFSKRDLSTLDLAAAGIKPYGTKGQVDLSGSFTSSSDSGDIIS